MSSRNRTRQSVRNRGGRGPPAGYSRGRSWEDPMGFDEPVAPRQTKFKYFCRSLATFMCTQVGVGGIIVGYAIVGAVVFRELETRDDAKANMQVASVLALRNRTAAELWHNFQEHPFNETEWSIAANHTLIEFQRQVVDAVKEGYNGKNATEQWNFPASLMFTLSIFTMIGYGNLVPRTDWGKVITIFYALFGIPLYVLYFMNMGRAFANAFKWVYIKLNSCSVGSSRTSSEDDVPQMSPENPPMRGSLRRDGGRNINPNDDDDEDDEPIVVPSTASLYVLLAYILVGTIMFSLWEEWDYLDAVYFCVTSLCKIGLGDFVPGTGREVSAESNQTRLMINFIYLLLGLGLVAMCYNLLKEEVLAKLKRLRTDLRDLCDFVRNDCSCANCVPRKNLSKVGAYCCLSAGMDVDVQANGQIEEGEGRGGESEQQQQHQNGLQNRPPGPRSREDNGNHVAMPEGSSSSTEVARPVIFHAVRGFEMRANDLIYLPPLVAEGSSSKPSDETGNSEPDYDPFSEDDEIHSATNSNKVLVFFGGDIQDVEEVMRTTGDYKNYIGWNLENTAQILQRQFPHHHIVVVRPVRMQIYMFSCFDNFVPSNTSTGHPEHTPNNFALQHLELLLKNLSSLIEQTQKAARRAHESSSNNGEVQQRKSETDEDSIVSSTTTEEGNGINGVNTNKARDLNPHLERASISLVGFSKGCVVLNQLIYEFHYLKTLTPDDRSMEGFLSSIKHMYWLDGGHSGGKNTWITSRSLLETLTRTGIRLHVHMTPYQLNDSRRPYIRREEKIFTEILSRLGATLSRHVHFEKEAPSLDIHFQVIAQFGLVTPEFEKPFEEENHELPSISILPISSDFES